MCGSLPELEWEGQVSCLWLGGGGGGEFRLRRVMSSTVVCRRAEVKKIDSGVKLQQYTNERGIEEM